MKASPCLLSVALVVCVLPGPALAQPGRLDAWRPDMTPPPNWQPGGAKRPSWPSRPLGLPDNPLLRLSSGGPHGIIPREPRVSDFIDQGQRGNPNRGAPQISVEALRQLANPVVPKIETPFAPANLPRAVPVRQVPPAAPPWQGWEWWAAGLGVLLLLGRVLRDDPARKEPAP